MEKYLTIAKFSDLEGFWARTIYRFFEMLPGLLSWGTILGFSILSFFYPWGVAVFIILFDLYWFFKAVYFSFYLAGGYNKMKENEKTDWMAKLDAEFKNKWQELVHLVVLPMYKEPKEIIFESLQSLANCDYPKDKMIVVLACEESGRKDVERAVREAQENFGEKFYKFIVTWHPAGLPNEIPGKASNETWAAKKAKELLVDPLDIDYQRIIFSSFDIDTVVFPKYFSCLSYKFLSRKNPHKFSYQPVPLFINNIEDASAISRVFSFSTSFWQMISQARIDKLITFSSHSMSFDTLVQVGFKQANIVSDDSRIFWQCFLYFDGDYAVCPLYYPVSMDANTAKDFLTTLKNIYKQQRRWAYGAGDIAYFMYGFLNNRKISLWKKVTYAYEVVEGHWAWACASVIIFLLGWTPLLFGGPKFSHSVSAYNLPSTTSTILTVSMVGLIWSAYFTVLLMPKSPYGEKAHFRKLIIFAQWLLVPLIMIFFTSFPALDAQTRLLLGKYMGFWVTPKDRKKN